MSDDPREIPDPPKPDATQSGPDPEHARSIEHQGAPVREPESVSDEEARLTVARPAERAADELKRETSRRSRRAFLTLGIGAVGAVAGWKWLQSGSGLESISPKFRKALNFDESVARNILFSDSHLAPEFPASEIQPMRVNGDEGLKEPIDLEAWRLKLVPRGASEPKGELSLQQIRALPRTEHITSLKCIEGWSMVTRWTGVKLSDFTQAFAAGNEKAGYVGFTTPDEGYYVGIEMASAMHPQTLLCYEMNGAPLKIEHGAPLRLVVPVKYGIKNIKRIGTITYTDERPADFWAENGYDYYAGL